ncbi:hypothetical protein WS52_31380 [Burkholderia territorii]|nr:hypothetical protein WS52_31380 [Burkholderia territorii]
MYHGRRAPVHRAEKIGADRGLRPSTCRGAPRLRVAALAAYDARFSDRLKGEESMRKNRCGSRAAAVDVSRRAALAGGGARGL